MIGGLPSSAVGLENAAAARGSPQLPARPQPTARSLLAALAMPEGLFLAGASLVQCVFTYDTS